MDLERLAKAIKERRREKKLTQEELADRAGVASSTVSNLEHGMHMPSIDLLDAVLRPLDLDIRNYLG